MSNSVLAVVPPTALESEEARLLEVIVAGRRAAADLATETSPERREDLRARVRAADEARQRIVASHQGLVAKLARRYRHSGVPLADLMQEGNIGLLAALDRFDPAAGRFASFAWYWVRQMMLAAIPRHRGGFCLTSGVARQVYRVRKVRDRLEAELGREASTAEMSRACGLSLQRVRQLESVNLPLHPLSESVSASVVDPAEDGDPSRITGHRLAVEAMHDLLAALPARERLVIRHRYGLDGPPRRLQDIGAMLGVTASRVCQIERDALRRLRQLAADQRDELLVA